MSSSSPWFVITIIGIYFWVIALVIRDYNQQIAIGKLETRVDYLEFVNENPIRD